MNPQHQLQLEDAQKKLALFKKHLDLLARCTGESKNIQRNEILSAVSELQSLVEWAAQRPDLGTVSAILLVKLQELHQIRENLEKNSSELKQTPIPEASNGEESTNSQKPEESTNSQNLECLNKDLVNSAVIATDSCHNNVENDIEEESVSVDKDSLCDYSVSTEDPNIANAESPQSIDDTNVEVIPNDDKTDEVDNVDGKDIVESMHVQEITVNCEQTATINSEMLQVNKEHTPDSLELQSTASEIKSADLYRSEVVIIETDEDNKSVEWINDPRNSNDPLDVCMYAIRNLYDSLKVKENELLKLSAMQSDQKQIEALQSVIIDFHKDITNLNSELELSKRENMLLKEQVLELEEAENDARLVAQKLEQKLIFLQEKDSHSQAELSQLKQNLRNTMEELGEKEKVEKELRSQIKYMETLVQKYEDQIKTIEARELEASKNAQKKSELQSNCEVQVKPETRNQGTQMYTFSQSEINRTASKNINDAIANIENNDLSEFQVVDISSETKSCEKSQNIDTTICSIDLKSVNETAHYSEQAEIVNLENIENISEKELLKRLHKLIDEDVNLQQQIHYVDEINLAMWKKLQNLDNHIGECKRQNINETNPVLTDTEYKTPEENIEREQQEQSNIKTDENIPLDSLNSLDKNEHYIQERLNKLKEINASFEKELKYRENLCKEKEKKYEEWMETEKRVINDLNRLVEEKTWITNQINLLKKDVDTRDKLIFKLGEEIISLKNKNQVELSKVRADQEKMTEPLIRKVSEMLTKEKEILKMISNFKLKENRNQGKSELERLKCNYIELQLELSQAREEIRKVEEKCKYLVDHCVNKHVYEETERCQELERVRNENARCIKMIKELQENEKDLVKALEKQEQYLHEVRDNYKKNMQETDEVQDYVETELESQLRLLEEGAAIATTVLKEERLKAERELEENIQDLKAKEEVYKARIAELERDVVNLHKEIHKMTDDSEEKKDNVQVEEKIPDEVIEKSIEILSSKTEIPVITPPTLSRSAVDADAKSSVETSEERTLQTTKDETLSDTDIKHTGVKEKSVEENVDELRAQVRELQSHIEKISEEVADLPSIQTPTPITVSSLNMQKEDIDYAEVDECCSEALRKQKDSNTNRSGHNHQSFYENKHSDAMKKQQAIEESTEENDYDEVLPRPTNFHVVQQVGADTLLVGWNYINPSVLEGFEVYVDDEVHDRIYIPDRTKALISGLNLRKPLKLSIFALSRYGQPSEPAVLEISPKPDHRTNYFDDEEDEYRDFEDPNCNKRPYSMEW